MNSEDLQASPSPVNDEWEEIKIKFIQLINNNPLLTLIFGIISIFSFGFFRVFVLILVVIFGIMTVANFKDVDKKQRLQAIIGIGLGFISFVSSISGINSLVFVMVFGVMAWAAWMKYLKSSGKLGENFVIKILNKLDPTYYKIINDVLLPSSGNTKTTQIDHIVVSNFGIFCIETKDYSGWIFGRADDEYWTQVIYHTKSKFYNPLRQNYAHVKSVENLIAGLNLPTPVFSFVVFPSADKLKISGTNNVGYDSDVLNGIKSCKKQVLSDSDRDIIYNAICQFNITNEDDRIEHIDSVASLNKL